MDATEIGTLLLGSAVMAVFPLYLILQLVLPWRWRGGWRIAALVPLLALVPALIHAGIALAMGSNLWPIFVIFTAPLGFLYLLVLIVLKRTQA